MGAFRDIFGGHGPLAIIWMVGGALFLLSTCKMFLQIALIRGLLYTAFLVWVLFQMPNTAIEVALFIWPATWALLGGIYYLLTFNRRDAWSSGYDKSYKPWDWSNIIPKKLDCTCPNWEAGDFDPECKFHFTEKEKGGYQ